MPSGDRSGVSRSLQLLKVAACRSQFAVAAARALERLALAVTTALYTGLNSPAKSTTFLLVHVLRVEGD